MDSKNNLGRNKISLFSDLLRKKQIGKTNESYTTNVSNNIVKHIVDGDTQRTVQFLEDMVQEIVENIAYLERRLSAITKRQNKLQESILTTNTTLKSTNVLIENNENDSCIPKNKHAHYSVIPDETNILQHAIAIENGLLDDPKTDSMFSITNALQPSQQQSAAISPLKKIDNDNTIAAIDDILLHAANIDI